MSTVTFSPTTAVMNDYPAGTVIIGRPGSGKTYFLLNVAANCFMTRTKMIFIDFKNDSLALTKIKKDLKVTDINKIEPGAMNPFKVIKNVDTNTLMSVIKCLCGTLTSAQVNSVSPIVKDFVTDNRRNLGGVDFLALTNYLYSSDNENAQVVGTMLKNHEDSHYGSLLFQSSENEDATDMDIGDVSQIITLFGMSIPPADREKWNEEDKFTSAIIYIITRILNDVLSKQKGEPTVLIIDESHIMYAIKEMSDLVDRMLVLGRSLNIAIVLSSQSMTHYPDDIGQLIANKFMFASAPDQAREFLNRFDASEDGAGAALDRPSIVNFINNLDQDTKGVCFMIDPRNRSGYVKIKSNLGVTSNPLLRDK